MPWGAGPAPSNPTGPQMPWGTGATSNSNTNANRPRPPPPPLQKTGSFNYGMLSPISTFCNRYLYILTPRANPHDSNSRQFPPNCTAGLPVSPKQAPQGQQQPQRPPSRPSMPWDFPSSSGPGPQSPNGRAPPSRGASYGSMPYAHSTGNFSAQSSNTQQPPPGGAPPGTSTTGTFELISLPLPAALVSSCNMSKFCEFSNICAGERRRPARYSHTDGAGPSQSAAPGPRTAGAFVPDPWVQHERRWEKVRTHTIPPPQNLSLSLSIC